MLPKKQPSTKLVSLIFIVCLHVCFQHSYAQKSIGDAGVSFDNSLNDPLYPFMNEWQKSGVEGGIPEKNSLPILLHLNPTNSEGIQNAINQLNTNGSPGVILLKKGTYQIDKPIHLKSNVILRGEAKEDVHLQVTIRSNGTNDEQSFIFSNVNKSGLEDLFFEYIPERNITIYDDRNMPTSSYCGDPCFSNSPDGLQNMYVSFVTIENDSKNCWVNNCIFKNAGSDPLEIRGDHNTFRNNFIDACFNKGGGGNGYYDIRGNYNLFYNEKVRRIRHFTIQQKAKYNVVIACDLEVDVNFHNGDEGYNLVEANKIHSDWWRSWSAFASGGSQCGHDKPGPNNIIFNNILSGKNNPERFGGSDKVFVFDQYSEPRLLRNTPPTGSTFYPVVLTSDQPDSSNNNECVVVENNGVVVVEAENYISQTENNTRKWFRQDGNITTPTPDPDPSHASSASGGSYVEILPDTRVTHADPLQSGTNFSNIPGKLGVLDYKIKFNTPGRYFVWVRSYSSGSEDNGIHVGLNGQWPASGQKMQWCGNKNQWAWESKQRTDANHCGEVQKIYLDIPSAGIHTVSFSMREDGFEFDKFILTQTYTKPTGTGPNESREGNCAFLSTADLKHKTPKIKIYPNPASHILNIERTNSNEVQAKIRNALGKVILETKISNKLQQLDVSLLPSGIYIVSLDEEKYFRFIKR
ncbi:T9SS type A sorting domain-containing protein [Tamlana sp. 2_MG-2023]|uniref:T9SS type A sorting domain-containing protein n=1 Tax=unclassified Tamlana TaxID=2614803 RepID=UPI0026E1D39E|nr:MULTISPECIES: T9SS type A sorting domain-containing protein [unclassified Tamlana]MDO6759009.1 T9SS type A sorting domain-containing protein [Tamlana sp. 2_MG-2023]MDO6789708.1 T9SS type A sorting domain-containing protein [Tamlana sp. 1_MG-2023]